MVEIRIYIEEKDNNIYIFLNPQNKITYQDEIHITRDENIKQPVLKYENKKIYLSIPNKFVSADKVSVKIEKNKSEIKLYVKDTGSTNGTSFNFNMVKNDKENIYACLYNPNKGEILSLNKESNSEQGENLKEVGINIIKFDDNKNQVKENEQKNYTYLYNLNNKEILIIKKDSVNKHRNELQKAGFNIIEFNDNKNSNPPFFEFDKEIIIARRSPEPVRIIFIDGKRITDELREKLSNFEFTFKFNFLLPEHDVNSYGIIYRGRYVGDLTLKDSESITIDGSESIISSSAIDDAIIKFNISQLTDDIFDFCAGSEERKKVLEETKRFVSELLIKNNINNNRKNNLFIYGLNGSGKDTLMKDICRIFNVEEEEINKINIPFKPQLKDFGFSEIFGLRERGNNVDPKIRVYCEEWGIVCFNELQTLIVKNVDYQQLLGFIENRIYNRVGDSEILNFNGLVICICAKIENLTLNDLKSKYKDLMRRFYDEVEIPEKFTKEDLVNFLEKKGVDTKQLNIDALFKKINKEVKGKALFGKIDKIISKMIAKGELNIKSYLDSSKKGRVDDNVFSLYDIVRYYILAEYYEGIKSKIGKKDEKDNNTELTYITLEKYHNKNIVNSIDSCCKDLINNININKISIYEKCIGELSEEYNISNEEDYEKFFGATKQTLKKWAESNVDVGSTLYEFRNLLNHLNDKHWKNKLTPKSP